MKQARLAVVGWLLPGGAYLLTRRYAQFWLALGLVSAAFGAGVLLQGGNSWPHGTDLQGLDGFTAMVAQAGAATRMLAGGPYLLARLLSYSQDFLGGTLHEYGSTLLTMAGLLNLLALADGLSHRRAEEA